MHKTRILGVFLVLLLLSLVTAQVRSDGDSSTGILARGFSLQSDWFRTQDRLDRLEVLQRVLAHIRESYLDPDRVNPENMFRKTLDEVSLNVAEVRVIYPEPHRAVLTVDTARTEFDTNLRNLYALQSAASDALKFVRDHKKSDVADRDLEVWAINGILSTLDPHSVYLASDLYAETKVSTLGKFGGLGIVIGIKNSKLTIIAPLDNTPAFRAGLKAGDQITKIDGEPTLSMALNEAVNMMRGPKGAPVTLSVLRQGWTAERSFTIKRDIINVLSVDSQVLGDGVGYVHVRNFQADTTKDLSRHLLNLHKATGGTLKGLVLDLRNDPGGLLDQAVAVADKFLPAGPIVTTVGAGNRLRDQEKATGQGTEPNYPMAVLVDQGSASASEIVAGALKRRDRAVVIGQRTFGKGTVQSLFELPEDSALKLTIAQYLTPGDYSIQSIGIEPDVKIVPAVVSKEYIDLFRQKYFEGEVTLERHFENPTSSLRSDSAVEMKYLEKFDENEDLRSAAVAGKRTAQELLQDFPIRVAFNLLKGHSQVSKAQLIELAKAAAPEVQKEEDRKIENALAAKGIDWSPPTSKASANCGIPTASWTVSPSGKNEIEAGRDVNFSVTISNPGPCTLVQSRAQAESKNFLLNNQEFLFGKVPPQGSVTRQAKISVPKFMPTSLATFQLKFFESHGVVPHVLRDEVKVKEAPKPRFAFVPELVDSNGPVSRGNGDGLIERGETIELRLRVRNDGPIASEDTAASLKADMEKAFPVKLGRALIGKLKPGEVRQVSFEWEVPASFDGRNLTFNLAVSDSVYRVASARRLTFSVSRGPGPASESGLLGTRRDHVPIYVTPSAAGITVGYASLGSVFPALSRYNDFTRVSLPSKRTGWIASENLRPVGNVSKSGERVAVEWVWLQPPKVTLAVEKLAFEPARSQFLRLQGQVSDEKAPKDMFILVNGRKVFYTGFSSRAGSAKPETFDTTIPLEAGLNRIAVVARNNEDLAGQATLMVQRLTTAGKEGEATPTASAVRFSNEDYQPDITAQ
ncbi:MAG: MXAN_5808 family serine peptidase [Pseudomonadota bacterium]